MSSTVVATIVATMPGVIINVSVEPGDKVEQGDVVLMMESMKMHIPIESTYAGTVENILVKVGEEVAEDAALVTLTA